MRTLKKTLNLTSTIDGFVESALQFFGRKKPGMKTAKNRERYGPGTSESNHLYNPLVCRSASAVFRWFSGCKKTGGNRG